MIWSRKRIYADAAAATPLSPRAAAELVRLLAVYGNPSALHKEALAAKEALTTARGIVADTIGAHADEIIFTSGGTEGNNLALGGVLRPLRKQHHSVHAVTSSIEHSSVLEPLRALREEGCALTEVPVSTAGRVSVEEVASAITDTTVLVSVQFVNSEIGTVQPIRDIAKEIRRVRKERAAASHGEPALPLYFHCDASQAPLWKSIQVEKLGADLLVLDGQKILGPKGVGALYVRRGVALEVLQLGGGQERGLRSGTENVPLAGAFAVALQDAQHAVADNIVRVAEVRNFLLQEIMQRLDVVVHGAVGDERVVNNLNFSVPGLNGEMAVIALDALGIAASTRSACDSGDEAPSHVLTALGLDQKMMQSALRLTLLPSATKAEARRIAAALAEVAKRYKE